MPFEDERFSYVGNRETDRPHPLRRVSSFPQTGKAHVSLNLCEPHGLAKRQVARRSAAAYKLAKKLAWGDALTQAGGVAMARKTNLIRVEVRRADRLLTRRGRRPLDICPNTTGFNYATMQISDNVAEQAEQTLQNIKAAMKQAKFSLKDVVRVLHSSQIIDFEKCWAVLQKHFGKVRPAAQDRGQTR